jgi:hypothetical protein
MSDLHFHADGGWDETLKRFISEFSDLIKKFTEMMSAFVASWKQVPAAGSENPPAIPEIGD